MRDINKILKDKNFSLVDDIKKADFILEENEIRSLKRNYRKTKNVYIKKSSKSNSKSDSGGGLAFILVLLIGIIISPILTYKFLPLWGKVLIITSMICATVFEIEAIYHRKSQAETKKCQQIANILFVIAYIIYGRNTFAIRNTFKKYDYIGADFKRSLIILGISIILIFLFVSVFRVLYYKIKNITSIKESFSKNKTILIISGIIILVISIITIYGATKGNASSNEQSDFISNQTNLFQLVDAEGVNLSEEGVTITYKLKNNTPSTISKINHCKFSFTDSQGNLLAEKEFENLKFNTGALEGYSEGVVTLFFSFKNEANEDLWRKITGEFPLTATLNDVVIN